LCPCGLVLIHALTLSNFLIKWNSVKADILPKLWIYYSFLRDVICEMYKYVSSKNIIFLYCGMQFNKMLSQLDIEGFQKSEKRNL